MPQRDTFGAKAGRRHIEGAGAADLLEARPGPERGFAELGVARAGDRKKGLQQPWMHGAERFGVIATAAS